MVQSSVPGGRKVDASDDIGDHFSSIVMSTGTDSSLPTKFKKM